VAGLAPNRRTRDSSVRVKTIHSWKPISKRQTGRPKARWENNVKKDVQKLTVPNWKTLVQEGRELKELIEKTKILHYNL
jgi:hypothetical protein